MLIDNSPLKRQLKHSEGSNVINGRHYPYPDSKGISTCGYGRNQEEKGYSEEEVLQWLESDLRDAKNDVEYWFDHHGIQAWQINEPRKGALIGMAFCHGRRKLGKYVKMWAAVKIGDWDTVADEILDSQFGREDPNRAKRLALQMREGRWLR